MTQRFEVPPNPARVIETLSHSGYTVHTAVADLIDNAITANATEINLSLSLNKKATLTIQDNGKGMSTEHLKEAMQIAFSPSSREVGDLGHFGTGLKSAAMFLSQIGSFSVISSNGQETTKATMRLSDLRKTGKWVIEMENLEAQEIGTSVVIHVPQLPHHSEQASQALMSLADHLSITFALLLADSIVIRIQGTPLKAWPLCNSHLPGMGSFSSYPLMGQIQVTPLILPISTENLRIEGPQGRHAHAGFHVYRNKRAIVSGGWLGLQIKQYPRNIKDRVRILIDLDNEQDEEWSISLTKSSVIIPHDLKKPLKKIVISALQRAGKHRNPVQNTKTPNINSSAIWETNGLINRQHPAVRHVRESIENTEILEELLRKLEGEQYER